MAERWAVATGNWSATGTWNGGTLPTSADDVYSNNFTVTIDQDVTVLSIRNTAGTTPVAGGGFTCSSTRTISANVIAGAVACLTLSGTSVTATHSGTVQGGTAASAYGISITGTSHALNHTSGAITGGSNATAHAINVVAATTVDHQITGSVTGGTAGTGLNFAGAALTATITGNIASGSTGVGVNCASGTWTGGGLLTVTGNSTGTGTGNALVSAATHSITLNGKFVAGQGHGLSYTGTGTVTVNNVGANAVEGSADALGSSDYGMSINSTTATVVVNGNVIGGTAGSNSNAIQLAGAIQGLTVTGNVTGGTSASAIGINAIAAVTNGITVNGTIKGGSGSGSFGLQYNLTQAVVATAVKGNDYGNGTVANQVHGISGTSDNGNVRAKQILFGDYGMAPVAGRIRLIDDVPNDLVQVPRYSDNVIISFRQTSFSADFPATSNVRNGTVYDSGSKTGTCYVPAASSVAYGVNVDATTGTAVLTQSDVRGAVGMASANLDTQIGNVPKNVWNFDLLANIATTVNRYSPWNAMRHILCKWLVASATKTVYKEDGTTTAYTTTVTSDATGITGDTP